MADEGIDRGLRAQTSRRILAGFDFARSIRREAASVFVLLKELSELPGPTGHEDVVQLANRRFGSIRSISAPST